MKVFDEAEKNLNHAHEKVEPFNTKNHRKTFWFGAACGAIVAAVIFLLFA